MATITLIKRNGGATGKRARLDVAVAIDLTRGDPASQAVCHQRLTSRMPFCSGPCPRHRPRSYADSMARHALDSL